jgi:hypothetical protein
MMSVRTAVFHAADDLAVDCLRGALPGGTIRVKNSKVEHAYLRLTCGRSSWRESLWKGLDVVIYERQFDWPLSRDG